MTVTEHATEPAGLAGAAEPAGLAGATEARGAAAVAGRPPAKRVLGLALGQLVTIQLAAAVAFAGLVNPGRIVGVACLAAASALLVLTLARSGGQWLYLWLPLSRGLRRRQVAQTRPGSEGIDTLGQLFPMLRLSSGEGPRGAPLGIAHDGERWTVVIAVQPPPRRLGGRPPSIPFDRLATLLDGDGLPLSAVQAVLELVPPPTATDAGSPDPSRPVQRGTFPSRRTVWLALTFDPTRCPAAFEARGSDLQAIHRALRRSAVRALELLDDAGLPGRLLAEDDLRELIEASTLDGGAAVPGRAAPHLEEARNHLRCDDVAHSTAWLKEWPSGSADASSPSEGLLDLVTAVAVVPALATTVSLTLTAKPATDQVSITALVRTTAPRDAVATTVTALRDAARTIGARLAPLTGLQAPALLASLPLGGTTPRGLPRITAHLLPGALGSWPRLRIPDSGLVLGAAPDGSQALVEVFRPGPTQIGAVATHDVGVLLAHRCLAAGARIDVVTSRPDDWEALQRACPARGQVRVHPPGAATPLRGTSSQPYLVIDDVEGTESGLRTDLGPWQAALTLRRNVSDGSVTAMSAFDTVLLQRVSTRTAALARDALRIPEGQARMLPMMPPDAVAVVAGGELSVIDLAVTGTERAAFGIAKIGARP